MRKLIYILMLGLILSSCGGDDESDVIINVKTLNYKTCYNIGDKIIFNIESFANEGLVSSINISTLTSNGFTQLTDTIIDTERTNFIYEYKVPQFNNDTENVKFYFKAYCSTGNFSEFSMTHHVTGTTPLHASEHSMFAFYKNEKNAFNIASDEIIDFETSDSTYIDIYDYSIDSTYIFKREWRSMTDLQFARFNDFDFENANYTSIQNAFTSANKSSKLTNISNDDIVLIGRENYAFGVFKIINVYDENDNMQDRYYFVFKSVF
ncbi:MAG: hypothetical protein IKU01_01940 [Bacteroidales bacterium]|nr:hypothetical protein [Bacteroidales bacterium]